jgi:polyisoprenoid-binding protein YceI
MSKILPVLLMSSCCAAASAAETYSVDGNHTHATFSFQHLGFSTFQGKVPARSGSIVLDRAQRTGSAEVVFDLQGVATGVAKFDEHLRGKDFFEVDRNPTATFKSSRITFQGDMPASVEGNLTLKGITKPVTLQVTSFKCAQHPMMKVPACGANATARIKRSDFGLGYALPAVPDEIGLMIEVEAMTKPAAAPGSSAR